MSGEDDDPLNDSCDACGAEVGEPCRPMCIGEAAAQDAADRASEEHDAIVRDTSDALRGRN